MTVAEVKRGFVDTPGGQIHYATAGQGSTVLLLHQTPRSWDEYREVLPLLGTRYRAIAMDTVGFGESYKPPREDSIEEYARGVVSLMDALAIDQAALVGHHTGGVIAVEVAAVHPDRVTALVLSSTPFVDAADRRRREERPAIDWVEEAEDGAHLAELWRKRMAFYPEHRPDLVHRFVLDALKVRNRLEAGHEAVGRYRMEEKTPAIRVPTLVLVGSADPFAHPRAPALAKSIPGSELVVLEGGMVPMVDQLPGAFARAVTCFLERALP